MSNLSDRPQNRNFAQRARKVNIHRRARRVEEYYKNPKLCKNSDCNNPIEYRRKAVQDFCSRSCAATINNKKRSKRSKESRQKTSLSLLALSERKPKSRRVWFRNCYSCDDLFTTRFHQKIYCDICREQTLKVYRKKARFDFDKKENPELVNKSLLRKRGWFHNENQNGVVFDHLFRVADGFYNKISPNIIKHPANAEMITMRENRRRQKRSTISLEELHKRIKLWESGIRNLPKTW